MAITDDSEDIVGAFFYPSVLWVTERGSVITIDEELKPSSYKVRQVVLRYQFTNGKRVIVTDDGFIGLFSKDENDSINFLNAIFGVSATYGIGCEHLINNDLCYTKLNSTSNEIALTRSNGPSERTMFAFLRDSPDDNDFQDWKSYSTRKPVSRECLTKIFKRVDEYALRPGLQKEILWVLNGYSIHYKESYEAAYLYGWMLIEAFLAQIWRQYVNSLQRSNNDKAALKDHRSWTSHHHIEMLSEIRKIDPTVRNLLNKLRKKRNEIVHDRKTVTNEESFGCLRVAIVIVVNLMNNLQDPFSTVDENPLVDLWGCRKEAATSQK